MSTWKPWFQFIAQPHGMTETFTETDTEAYWNVVHKIVWRWSHCMHQDPFTDVIGYF